MTTDTRMLVLAKKVRWLRKQAGMTQDELAAASGISRATVNYIENGTIDPRFSTVYAIAEVLGWRMLG